MDQSLRKYVRRDDKYVRVTQKQLGNAFIDDKAIKEANGNNPGAAGSATIKVIYISSTCRTEVEDKTYSKLFPGLAYRGWDGNPGLAVSGNPKTRSNTRSILDLGWKAFFLNGTKPGSNFKPTRYVDPALDIKLFYRFGFNSLGITFDIFKQLVADTVKETKPKQNVEVVQSRPGSGWVFVRKNHPLKGMDAISSHSHTA
jgi:hypothetical protein